MAPSEHALEVQSQSINGNTPVLIVPGIGGTLWADGEDETWYRQRGVGPDKLQIDPLLGVYDDLIQTFENLGYTRGEDLFVANYDWRVEPAPGPGGDAEIDGAVDGLTVGGVTDSTFEYGVDYLAYWMDQADQAYKARNAGAELSHVNVVAHSTGGLVARSYIQSGLDSDPANPLPAINDVVMMGVPQRGAGQAWNPLNNNWNADPATRLVTSKLVANAYEWMLANERDIVGSDYDISYSDYDPATGTKDLDDFVEAFVPTLRGLLATYDFLDTNPADAPQYEDLNTDPAARNGLVLDLNDGLDLFYEVADLNQNYNWQDPVTNEIRTPNGWADLVNGDVTIIYGNQLDTGAYAQQRSGPDGAATIVEADELIGEVPQVGEIWYEMVDDVGDGTVPAQSSAGQYMNSGNVFPTDPRVTLRAIDGTDIAGNYGDSGELPDHTALMSHEGAIAAALDGMGISHTPSQISANNILGVAESLCQVITRDILNPRELVEDGTITEDLGSALDSAATAAFDSMRVGLGRAGFERTLPFSQEEIDERLPLTSALRDNLLDPIFDRVDNSFSATAAADIVDDWLALDGETLTTSRRDLDSGQIIDVPFSIPHTVEIDADRTFGGFFDPANAAVQSLFGNVGAGCDQMLFNLGGAIEFEVEMPLSMAEMPMPFDADFGEGQTITATARFEFDLSLGYDDALGQTVEDQTFFEINTARIEFTAGANDVDYDFALGLFQAQLDDADLEIDVFADLSMDEDDDLTTVAEWTDLFDDEGSDGDYSDFFRFDSGGTAAATLPVSLGVGGFGTLGSETIQIDSVGAWRGNAGNAIGPGGENLLRVEDNPVFEVSFQNFDELTNLSRLGPDQVVTAFGQLADALAAVVDGQQPGAGGLGNLGAQSDGATLADALDFQLPFSHDTALGDLMNFGEALTENIDEFLQERVDPVRLTQAPTFDTLGELIDRLAQMAGVDPALIHADYDPDADAFTIGFAFEHAFAEQTEVIDFGAEVAAEPLAQIRSGSEVSVTALVGADGKVGVDLSDLTATVVAPHDAPSDGVLTEDAVLNIWTPARALVYTVTLPADATADNTSLDDLVDDLNAAIATRGLYNVAAQRDADNPGRIALVGRGYRASTLNVSAEPANAAVTEMGFAPQAVEGVNLLGRTFVEEVNLYGEAGLQGADVDAYGKLGFVEVGLEDSVVDANLNASFSLVDVNDADGRLYLREIARGEVEGEETDFRNNVGLTGSASATLPVTASVLGIEPAPNARLQLDWTDLTDPSTLTATTSGLEDLETFRDMEWTTVVGMIGDVATYLGDELAGQSFMQTDLPLLNRNAAEILDFTADLSDKILDVAEDPNAHLGNMAQKLENALGLPDDSITLQLDADDVLRFTLDLVNTLSEDAALDMDLVDLFGSEGALPPEFAGITEILGARGGGRFALEAFSDLTLDLGIDLSDPFAPVPVLYESTGLELGLKAEGAALDASLQLADVLGVYTRGGELFLGDPAHSDPDHGDDFATIRAGVADLPGGDAQPIADLLAMDPGDVFDLSFTGEASATLPLFFPSENDPVLDQNNTPGSNELQLTIADLADIGGTTSLTGPDLAQLAGSLDLLDKLQLAVNGLDFLLEQLQAGLERDVFGASIPLVGDQLAEGVRFIEDIRQSVVPALQVAAEAPDATVELVGDQIFAALGPAGLGLVAQRSDIVGNLDVNAGEVVWDIGFLDADYEVGTEIDFDLGLPALGLDVAFNPLVEMVLDAGLAFGLSTSDGFFFDVGGEEFIADLDVTIPDSSATGRLAFLELTAEDAGTLFSPQFVIDIGEPSGDGRLTWDEFGGDESEGPTFDATISGTADVLLDLTLSFAGNPNFPTLTSDFVLEWVFDGTDTEGQTPDIRFDNVRLSAGQFINNFISPVVTTIQDIIDPVRPVIDALRMPVPVLGQALHLAGVADEPVRMIDLAKYIPDFEIDGELIDSFDGFLELVQIIDDIPVIDDQVMVDLGSFDLSGNNRSELEDPGLLGFLQPANQTEEDAVNQFANLGGTEEFINKTQDVSDTGVQFSLPFLEDPASVFRMLLGQGDVELFEFDMGGLDFEFELYESFPVFPGISVGFGGRVFGGLNLGFGFDTSGLRDFFENNKENPEDVFNGFYIKDEHTENNVERDIREAYLGGALMVGASADIKVAEVGVRGGPRFTAEADLRDQDRDGKVHVDEFIETLEEGLRCTFELGGVLEGFLEVFVETKGGLEFTHEVASVELVDFGFTEPCFPGRFEANESRSIAADLGVAPGVHVTGDGLRDGDLDWYAFDVLREDDLQVDVLFEQGNSDQNIDIEIYNVEGDLIERGRSNDSNERLILENMPAGQYFLKVFGAREGVEYDIEITPGPESATTAYYVAGQNDQPIGNDNIDNPPLVSYYTRAKGDDANDGLSPLTPKATIQGLLDDPAVDLDDNSIVLIDGGTYLENVVVDPRHSGAILAGAPMPHTDWLDLPVGQRILPTVGTTLSGAAGSPALRIDGADDLMIHGLDFTIRSSATEPIVQLDNGSHDNQLDRNRVGGRNDANIGVEVSQTADAPSGTLVTGNVLESTLGRSILIESGGGTTVRGNLFTDGTLEVTSTGVADITENDFESLALAIKLQAGAVGLVSVNQITDATTGIDSDALGVPLEENTISGATVGLTGGGLLGPDNPARGNEVFDGGTGVLLPSDASDAIVRHNVIHDNVRGIASDGGGVNSIFGNEVYANEVGIVGGAVVGSADWDAPNVVRDNTEVGISASPGSEVRFNRVLANPVGIEAASASLVHHNVIARNVDHAIEIDSDNDVEVVFNTIHAPTGNGVTIVNNADGATLNHNIIWTEAGPGISVDLTSQNGFQSDYNNLYRSGSGELVRWQKAYRDLYNWQAEAGFDLNSIGWTAPDPDLDDPVFVDAANNDYRLTDQASSSLDAGDPTLDASIEPAPNGARANLGAYGLTAAAAVSSNQWLKIEYPQFHVDWKVDEGRDILWDSHGLSGDVRVELVDDAGNAVALIAVTDIADESLNWSPQQSGVAADNDAPYRIRLTALQSGEAAASRETFLVPELGGQTYYVDDHDDAGDQYTPNAVGDNRNAGASPDAPKASLQALLFMYDLGDGDQVFVDHGNYQVVIDMVVSGDPLRGNDEGVAVTGPTAGGLARLERGTVLPGTEVVDLFDADFTTFQHLEMVGGEHTLRVRNSSTNFTGSNLNLLNASSDGLVLDSTAENAALDHLVVSGHGRHGIVIRDVDIDSLTDSVISDNAQTGLVLDNVGDVRVLRNTISGNNLGIDIDHDGGATAIVGDDDLTDGNTDGNIVHDNAADGIDADGNVLIAGNTVFGHPGGRGLNLRNADATHNVVFNNHDGVNTRSGGEQITRNHVYGNQNIGVILRYGADAVGNVLANNNVGIHGATNGRGVSGEIRNNLIYDHDGPGVDIRETDGRFDLVNNTVDAPADATAVRLAANADDVALRNNILLADDGTALVVEPGANLGLDSDYNLFHITGAGNVANWQGFSLPTLVDWQQTGLLERSSLQADPDFIDRASRDYHPASTEGSYHGGTLAPVLDPTTNLPVANPPTLTTDATRSPAVDRGDLATPFANEPTPNGGYVNLGAYGNTEQASHSPTQFLFVVSPDGGEVWPAEQQFQITWRSAGLGNAVDLDLIDASTGGLVESIAIGTPNDGGFDWTLPDSIAPADTYAVRVSEASSGFTAESNQPFEITEPINAFYVNLATDADLTDNQYTTAAGSPSNDGTTPATPIDSIGGLLAAYDLGENDIVFIEGGEYPLNENIVVEANDAGVTFRGTTTGPATVINRNDRASNAYAFELVGLTPPSPDAYGVAFENLTITGGEGGILADRDAGNDTVRIADSIIAGNDRYGIDFNDGNTNLQLIGNTFFGDQDTSEDEDDQDTAVEWRGDGGLAQGNLFYDHDSRGLFISADDTQIQSNVFRNTRSALYITNGDNHLVVDNEFDGNRNAAYVFAENTTIAGNLFVNDEQVALEIIDAHAVDADPWGPNEFTGNWRALDVNSRSLAEGNIVHNNDRGIFAEGFDAVVRDNLAYDNASYGIYTRNNNQVLANTVYGNNVGIDANGSPSREFDGVVANNLIFDNHTFAVRVDQADNNNPRVHNNTIVHPAGDAVHVTSTVESVDVRNNIIAFGGTAIAVASGGENGFASDYNLFHNLGGGTLYEWLGRSYATQADVFYNTGNDGRSVLGDPLFVDPANDDYHVTPGSPAIDAGDPTSPFADEPTPNGLRVNIGAFGNSPDATNSPAELLNLVDPIALQKFELGGELPIAWQTVGINPLPDADDRYAAAVQSANPLLYFRMNEAAGPALADSSGNGFTGTAHNGPTFGAGGAFGPSYDDALATDVGYQYVNVPDDPAFDLTRQATISMWVRVDDASANWTPLLVKGENDNASQTFGLYYNEDDDKLRLRTADAQGVQTLDSPHDSITLGRWHHVAGVIDRDAQSMSLFIDGRRVAEGAVRGDDAVTNNDDLMIGHFPNNSFYYRSFDGAIDEVALMGSALSDAAIFEQSKAHLSEVDIDLVSLDNTGAVVESIQVAENTPDIGGYTWDIPTGGIDLALDWRVRVTSQQGGQPADLSATLALAGAGNAYYINDGSTADDVYTTAAGDNTFSGKTPDQPMASLAALLSLYDLGPGDTVYIDTGGYDLLTNIDLTGGDSGVTLRGAFDPGDPGNPAHVTMLDRGNRDDGNYVFELHNADDVTLEHLHLTGAEIAVHADRDSGSTGLTVRDSELFHNQTAGIHLRDDNHGLTVERSTFYGNLANGGNDDDNQDHGVESYDNDDVTIRDSSFSTHHDWGVYLNRADDYLIENNTFDGNEDGGLWINNGEVGTVRGNDSSNNADQYGNRGTGFYIQSQNGSIVEDNTAFGNVDEGFEIFGATTARSNIAYNNHIGFRLIGRGGELIGNTAYDNAYGFYGDSSGSGPGLIQANTAYANTTVGIWGNGATEVLGNTVRDNDNVGIRSNDLVLNNLVYGNGGTALTIPSNNGQGRESIVRNNTILSDGATAISLSNDARDVLIENNIVQVADATAIVVGPDNTAGFDADYNLYDLRGAATLADWSGLALADADAWFHATGNDGHAVEADPRFVDPTNEDFRLAPDSPAVDAGRLDSPFADEPLPNGQRVNLGAYGDTAHATVSNEPLLQVVDPFGLQKFQLGGEMAIRWHTAGLAPTGQLQVQTSGAPDPSAGATRAFSIAGGPALNADPETDADADAAMTVAMWVRPTEPQAEWTPLLVTGPDETGDRTLGLYFNRDGYLHFTINDDSGERTLRTASGSVVPGRWHHVAAVVDPAAAMMSLHVDGELAASRSTAPTLGPISTAAAEAAKVERFNDQSFYNHSWTGGTDNVALFDEALTDQRIAEQAQSQSGAVDIELLALDAGGSIVGTTTIAAGADDDGAYTWPIPASGLDLALDYRVRVTAAADPALADESETFRIANGGNAYYINDGSTDDDLHTTAVGDDANTGKSPDAPMATLGALLRAYDLGPGDTVHVDTGHYRFHQTLHVVDNDSGATIAGPFDPADPDNPAHHATLDRGNPDFPLLTLDGVDDLTLERLTFTGGSHGLLIPRDAHADDITVRHGRFETASEASIFQDSGNGPLVIEDSRFRGFGTIDEGVDARSDRLTIRDSVFEGFDNRAIDVDRADHSRIEGNLVRDTGQSSIALFVNNSDDVIVRNNELFNNDDAIEVRGDRNLVEGNLVRDNAGIGIDAFGATRVINNTVHGNDLGVLLNTGADAENNRVFDNNRGIYGLNANRVTGNTVYGQSNYGIALRFNASAYNNRVHDNLIGIRNVSFRTSSFTGQVAYNLLYNNTDTAIDFSFDNGPGSIYHNTVYQEVGDAVRLRNDAATDLRNNILWTDQGNIIYVEGPTLGFAADRNLYHRGDDPGNAVLLDSDGGPTYASLGDWSAADPASNADSIEGDPGFIDPDGADDVLGTNPQRAADDNFNLSAGSPAIDAAQSWLAQATDFIGAPRLDDPGSPNIGSDAFAITELGPQPFAVNNNNGSFRTDNGNYSFYFDHGFTFPFFGETHDRVYLSTNGFLSFENVGSLPDNSDDALAQHPIVAPLWDDLTLTGGNRGLYIDESAPGEVRFQWQGENKADGGDVNFAVTLFADGEIEFDYGPGNTNLTPTVGVSGGYGGFVHQPDASGAASLSNAPTLRFDRVPGFADIGALEFAGNSNDVTPPSLVDIAPDGLADGATNQSVDTIGLTFNEALSTVDARSAASYRLVDRNDNSAFDLLPVYTTGSTTVQLELLDGPLPEGDYRLELISTADNGLHDLAGLALDGGTYAADFSVDTTAPTAALVSPAPGLPAYTDAGYVDVRFDDDGAGLDPATVAPAAVSINGLSVDSVQNRGGGLFRFHYDGDGETLDDGDDYTVDLVGGIALDAAGNPAAGRTLGSFTYDATLDVQVDLQGGATQRSRIDRVLLTFDEPITGLAPDAVTLSRLNHLGDVDVLVNDLGDGRRFELTFAGPHTRSGAAGGPLADGRYTLTIDPAAIIGQNSGRSPASNAATDFHVLFGDTNGDERLTLMEYLAVQGTLDKSSGDPGFLPDYDYNGDGAVDTDDALEVRSRFRQSVDDRVPSDPPASIDVVPNPGESQRSMVGEVVVYVDRDVDSFDADAFSLTRTRLADGSPDNSDVALQVAQRDSRSFTIGFTGPAGLIDAGSLADGVFELSVDRRGLFDAGGDAIGTTTETARFHRLLGDADGDGDFDLLDYYGVRDAFGRSAGQPGYASAYDVDDDDDVDLLDLDALRDALQHDHANLANLANPA